MLQASVPNVSSVFLDVCCKCVYLILPLFHTYVISVLSECCVYFAIVSNVFQVFL
jgi:hypothetical protein